VIQKAGCQILKKIPNIFFSFLICTKATLIRALERPSNLHDNLSN
jgi:hypothetical protein